MRYMITSPTNPLHLGFKSIIWFIPSKVTLSTVHRLVTRPAEKKNPLQINCGYVLADIILQSLNVHYVILYVLRRYQEQQTSL